MIDSAEHPMVRQPISIAGYGTFVTERGMFRRLSFRQASEQGVPEKR
jgi:hypothetical protein